MFASGDQSPEPSKGNLRKPFTSPLLTPADETAPPLIPIKPQLKAFAELQNFKPINSPFKSPLTESKRAARKGRKDAFEEKPRPLKKSLIDHEAMIKDILSRPFVVPIANYVPEYTTKTLGMRKVLIRR